MDCDAAWENKPTFLEATTGITLKWSVMLRNSILMTRHYPDLSKASDWLRQISHEARPIRSTTQIYGVTRHLYEISAHVPRRKKRWKGVCSRGDKITISSDTGNCYKAKCLLCYVLFPSHTKNRIQFVVLHWLNCWFFMQRHVAQLYPRKSTHLRASVLGSWVLSAILAGIKYSHC